jgi:hypothetical protein
LWHWIRRDELAMVEWLLKHRPRHRRRAIQYSCLLGHRLALERLSWNVSLNWSACLAWAAAGQREEFMSLCLDHGADPERALRAARHVHCALFCDGNGCLGSKSFEFLSRVFRDAS